MRATKAILWATLVIAQIAMSQSNDKTPARRFHDSERDKAVQQTLVRIDPKKNIWVLRNGSDWYLTSVSFMCDTSESIDEHFVYMPADGAWIAPWVDVRATKGKQAPWGFGFPGDDDSVRHVAGARQDLLDAEAAEWYIRNQRVFNCRTTDVQLDHKQPLGKQVQKTIGGRARQ